MTKASDREAAEKYGKFAVGEACYSNPTNPFSDYEVKFWATNGFEAGIAHARRELEAQLDDARNTRLAIKLVRAENERDQLRAENLQMEAALRAIIIHGQHPSLDINWAVYVLDLANSGLTLPHTAHLARQWELMERIVEKCAVGECNDTLSLQLHKELDEHMTK